MRMRKRGGREGWGSEITRDRERERERGNIDRQTCADRQTCRETRHIQICADRLINREANVHQLIYTKYLSFTHTNTCKHTISTPAEV